MLFNRQLNGGMMDDNPGSLYGIAKAVSQKSVSSQQEEDEI